MGTTSDADRLVALQAVANGEVARNGSWYLYLPRTARSSVLHDLYREGLIAHVHDERGSVELTAAGRAELASAPSLPTQPEPASDPYEPTKFIEANALLSVQIDDENSAWTHLESLLTNELKSLANAAMRLTEMAEIVGRNQEANQ